MRRRDFIKGALGAVAAVALAPLAARTVQAADDDDAAYVLGENVTALAAPRWRTNSSTTAPSVTITWDAPAYWNGTTWTDISAEAD